MLPRIFLIWIEGAYVTRAVFSAELNGACIIFIITGIRETGIPLVSRRERDVGVSGSRLVINNSVSDTSSGVSEEMTTGMKPRGWLPVERSFVEK